jgi:hypothetical protein
VILFLDVPSRVFTNTVFPTNGFYPQATRYPSVSVQLGAIANNWRPFAMHINMDGTNDCKGYIDKLAAFGTNGQLIISASGAGYGNTNYYFDNAGAIENQPTQGTLAKDAVIANGAASLAVTYAGPTNVHIALGTNVASYMTFGQHGGQGGFYPTNGTVVFVGNSGWYVIETIESFNGLRYQTIQGNFIRWFADVAFGGNNYLNTPVGAVTHVDEPGGGGWNDPAAYFGLWQGVKSFAACAWNSKRTPYFMAVGDPLVRR